MRVDGQKSAYIPIMKQGGDTNTIAVVDGVRELTKHLYDIPKQMKTSIVFDQSVYREGSHPAPCCTKVLSAWFSPV